MFALTVLVAALPAHALDCMPWSLGDSLPADGAVDVPLNAMPAVALYGGADPDNGLTVALLDAEGAAVDASLELLAEGDPAWYQVVPVETLQPSSAYTLEVAVADHDWMEDARITFSTGEATDDAAPAPAGIDGVSQSSDPGGDWGPEHELVVQGYGGEDDHGPLFLVEFSDDEAFSDPLVRMRGESPQRFFHGLCTFDDAATLYADTQWIRVTPIDIAGNRGEASVLAPGEGDGKGCSVLGGLQLGWLGALVGLAAVARRRDPSDGVI